jgi:hypothetical protein
MMTLVMEAASAEAEEEGKEAEKKKDGEVALVQQEGMVGPQYVTVDDELVR